jgi:acetyltransferase-like isoleucine patch superfamily enzyme
MMIIGKIKKAILLLRLRLLANRTYSMLKFKCGNRHANIELPCRVTAESIPNIHIGKNVTIKRDAWFSLSDKIEVYIGDNTSIGRSFTISGVDNFIRIGNSVLFSERVFITESQHGYEDIQKPIINQGAISRGPVTIEDECWIGMNACIMPGVTIGKHSIIGSNAVVTKSIPPYSVAVGTPAVVIKHYDSKSNRWVAVKKNK